MRKRRMPDEKLAELVSKVNFETLPNLWMPQLEKCFHQVLRYEYYLKKIPDYLALPKYRKIVVRIVYRLLSQVPGSRFEFSKNILYPDPVIREFMHYLAQAEIRRKQEILKNHPLTQKTIRSLLRSLKSELEI